MFQILTAEEEVQLGLHLDVCNVELEQGISSLGSPRSTQ